MFSTKKWTIFTIPLILVASVSGQTTTPAPAVTTNTVTPSVTAVSECHAHGTTQYCMVGTTEYQVIGPTKTEEMEPQYTGCHSHGTETSCYKSNGIEVELLLELEEIAEEPHTEEEHKTEGQHCHFHAGVEHCIGGNAEATCDRTDRKYNVTLRIGLAFVILLVGAIGVSTPILATSFTRVTQNSIVFVILKQIGTGVVISTAFVHLFTHASLMFANKCLGELAYEGATAAIFMAGLFLSFLVDYLGARFILWRQSRKNIGSDIEQGPSPTDKSPSVTSDSSSALNDGRASHVNRTAHVHGTSDGKLGVMVLESGIIFHSLLIGLTLVVAADPFFLTLFAVIIFHQMFEGLALGTCIAGLAPTTASFPRKLLMALAFTLITPLGMAIGIGVLGQFNGNDKSTVIAIGTLDALSAGILAWVGIVEMLAKDWLHGGLLEAGCVRTAIGMTSLVTGMVGMSVLGKWA
ncbi:zinc/iron transporter protein [Pleomassaria siparia CBS 279.74]|uniref:Zinc/iron transporter protein n=1 Tax=Pleomassaria siparia CBS 279.74 TaxID=1314801 RepID=A0A6G1KT52_9PLEO|nr:zinc/iron transporter protein [Pleomassaria siparia CBS 279.74]